MNKDISAIFRQSLTDFPCPVVLGKKLPSFGLHRYKKGLQFIPPADEGFTLRGDKRRLLYHGRRCSHRFTILGDTSFEYDCILEREPESNVVSLLIEGAEHYDFFRQPDFVKDPFLKGSYAVYKKETLIGEGTGKLCHIHRPLIIDARGRRVWGDLAVVGNELRIIIPEKWLAEAKYPVIVDPTIGTTTVGKQNFYDNDGYEDVMCFYGDVAVNRFLVSQTVNGTCTAYAYVYDQEQENFGYGIIYSDKNNKPLNKLTYYEEEIPLVHPWRQEKWQSGTFELKAVIPAGSYIWFGIMANYWAPLFDYGSLCYYTKDKNYYYIPETFPTSCLTYDMKLSMYFTYNSANNFSRKVFQRAYVSENRKYKKEYKRILTQTVSINSLLKRIMSIYHKCKNTAHNVDVLNSITLFRRILSEHIIVISQKNIFISFIRECFETVNINTFIQKLRIIFRNLHEELSGYDRLTSSMKFMRVKKEIAHVKENVKQWRVFIRGIVEIAENTAETSHIANYNRLQRNTVKSQGSVLRNISFVVRIITKLFIRDYLVARFLKSKTELTLKSKIVREIILDSKLND